MSNRNFPCNTKRVGVTMNVTSTAQTFALGSTPEALADAAASKDGLFDNRGGEDCYLVAGGANVRAATAGDIRVPAGAIAVWDKGNATHVSVIGDGNTTLVAHCGVGD